MEQYFAKQSANCCKLNFSNKLVPPHKYILSPKKTTTNPTAPIHKSAKKSLKAAQSHQTLTNSKDTKKSTQFQSGNGHLKEKQEQLNDYGQVVERKGRTETKKFDTRRQIKNSAENHKIKQVKSLERKQVMLSPNKTNSIEDMRMYRFSQKPNLVRVERQQLPRGSVFVKTITNPVTTFRQQPVFTQTVPHFYRQSPNPYPQPHNSYHPIPHFHQIPTYAKSPTKYQPFRHPTSNSYTTDYPQTTRTRTPALKKQSSTNYTQNFKRLYGQMEMQQQIKHDLMVSLELNRKNNDFQQQQQQQDYGYHLDNGVSMLTKCPPSQQSTILPPQSKLRRKFQYQIDSFANHAKSPDRKVGTQKFLKVQSLLTHKPESLKLNGRQKFKSIVSVESQHSSSSADVDSVIIDQHPQHLLSSNPIKSLL